MTKDKLEKEATEFEENYTVYEVAKRKDGSDYAKKVCKVTVKEAYLAGSEPREKQIQIDAEQIRALQKQNGELTDKVKELEAQIEKMKCCGNCKYFKFVGESLKGNYQCLKDGDKGKYYRSCNNFENWEIRR